ncbi:MAG: D-aminoacyl-tRNA deacylase [Candidatus Peregrinibacteria bacterium]
MRLLLQRVLQAQVNVDGKTVGAIAQGYLLFLGVMKGDSEIEAKWLAEKVSKLRLFDSDSGKVNDWSILDIGGEVLVISQFTLAADIANGNRPDYTLAAPPVDAEKLYETFISLLKSSGIKKVEAGVFGAEMEVSLINDGPVTLELERKAE